MEVLGPVFFIWFCQKVNFWLILEIFLFFMLLEHFWCFKRFGYETFWFNFWPEGQEKFRWVIIMGTKKSCQQLLSGAEKTTTSTHWPKDPISWKIYFLNDYRHDANCSKYIQLLYINLSSHFTTRKLGGHDFC